MHASFPRYREFSPLAPTFCVTPGEGRVIHRYFDTCPFSPSGRYLAVFRLPREDRPPLPGEQGEVVVVDLETAREQVVAKTAGWESQVGANLNWGSDDDTLIFNDVDVRDWTAHGVKLNWRTGAAERFAHGVYHVSPDGRFAACGDMGAMRRTQGGYGVILPDDRTPRHVGLPDDEGVWITNLETLESKLLISLREVVERTVPKELRGAYEAYENYVFHTKWSPRGDRLMFSTRRFPHAHSNRFNVICDGVLLFDVFTITPEGKELHNALDSKVWENYGHHTNWLPDGEELSLNLAVKGGKTVYFCRVGHDGSNLRTFFDAPVGSGHPTMHPSGKFLLTDVYSFEPLAFPDGTAPLRLIDLATRQETRPVRISIKPAAGVIEKHIEMRCDPHPAWDRGYRYVAFNGMADGTRRVYVADLQQWI